MTQYSWCYGSGDDGITNIVKTKLNPSFTLSLPLLVLYINHVFLKSYVIHFFLIKLFQGIVTQLSEQISTLNERMDEFTSRIEELNSKILISKVSASQQNLVLQAEVCNATSASSLYASGVGNGPFLPNSSSSSQLARESAFMEEVIPQPCYFITLALNKPSFWEREDTKFWKGEDLELVNSETKGWNKRRREFHFILII